MNQGANGMPPDLGALRDVADKVSGLLRRLANPDRLLILCQLVEGELNVGELSARTGIQQPTLSQQLTVLRQDGLVGTERRGKYIYYRLESQEVLVVMRTLYELYCAPGA